MKLPDHIRACLTALEESFRAEPDFLRLLDTDEPFFSLKLKYEGETLVLAVLNGTRIV